MDNRSPDFDISDARGIGPKTAELLGRVGVRTFRDALFYLPFRYEDRKNLKPICQLQPGPPETVRGRIISSAMRRLRGRFSILDVAINDGTAILSCRWFNQPFLKKALVVGQELIVHGAIRSNPFGGPGLQIDNPEYELVSDAGESAVHTGRIVPFYRLTEGLGQKQLRKIMLGIISSFAVSMPDYMPGEIVARKGLPALAESIRQVHFPDEGVSVEALNSGVSPFHARLAFDELFLFEFGLAVIRRRRGSEKGSVLKGDGRLRRQLLSQLPYELTAAQERVSREIEGHMKEPAPMHLLLQGDVGSGKTVVSVLAMLNAVECGHQAALMAPTEVLAEQHYANVRSMVGPLGVNVALLTGSRGKENLEEVRSGTADIVVGTHALIQERVAFRRLGLAVIDEQHKFGVAQRALLRQKGASPDVLVMTATPIPRSLALTLYGDLDCAVLDELPAGRSPVLTGIVDSSQKQMIYDRLRTEISGGRQAYVVYPAIEESEKSDLRSALQGRDAFRRIFPEFRTDILHGRMKPEEKDLVMKSFKAGETDILVCTTVIEVGVDVPNATLMLIVHAERFGLSQLHQLRGRVGRGSGQSSCLLIAYGPLGEDAKRRLQCMAENNNGFRIAEEDLALRGPGEFFGVRQAGMPDMVVADIIRDGELLDSARAEAFELARRDPELGEHPLLRVAVERFWKGKAECFRTG